MKRKLELQVDYKDYVIMIYRVHKQGQRIFTVGNIEYGSIKEAKADIDSWYKK